jgi:hypothetical protein
LLGVAVTVEQSLEKYGEYLCFVERTIATHDLARLCIKCVTGRILLSTRGLWRY